MARPPSTRRSLTRAIAPALAAAVVAAAVALVVVGTQAQRAAQTPADCIIPGPPGIGGPFALENGAGRTVTERDFAGGPALVYFGFTHCPDVCPTSLYAIADALKLAHLEQTPVALITVDPARDTPAVMATYAASEGFPAQLQGLSGPKEAVDAALASFRVAAIPQPGAAGDYSISHSSLLYLMGPDWRLRGVMSTMGKTPQDLASCIGAAIGNDLTRQS